jgi:hypothetical protein
MEIRVELEIYIDGTKEKTFGIKIENMDDLPDSVIKNRAIENLPTLIPSAREYIGTL